MVYLEGHYLTTEEFLEKAQPIIKVARWAITPFESWTDGPAAKDENGYEVEPYNKDACQWCAVGSIRYAVYLAGDVAGFSYKIEDLLHQATKHLFGDHVATLVTVNEYGIHNLEKENASTLKKLPPQVRHDLVLSVMDFVLNSDSTWIEPE